MVESIFEILPRLKNQNTFLFEESAVSTSATQFMYNYVVMQSFKYLLGEKATCLNAIMLMSHWCIDRKMRETLEAFEIDGNLVWRSTSIMMLVQNVYVKKTKAKFDVTEFFAKIIVDSSFGQFIGLNRFEDVLWFNKEYFNDFIAVAEIAHAIDYSISEAIEMGTMFSNALESSNYKFEDLCSILIPVTPSANEVEDEKGKKDKKEKKEKNKKEK